MILTEQNYQALRDTVNTMEQQVAIDKETSIKLLEGMTAETANQQVLLTEFLARYREEE
ncbi:hypothetical protein [Syntrophomonas wolfei]|uniref:hypothetical protein n=1 Tax=Syntrophomonas wolfei TaxID=863 RepID=UPI0023F39DA5|nr:hypothetical protein [Syntrophomonas wolfei]